MKILQLCCALRDGNVFRALVENIAKRDLEQQVYVAVFPGQVVSPSKIKNLDILASPQLNLYTRINYFHKIKKLVLDLEKHIELRSIDLIHSHFLFSDGGIALELKRKYGIPFMTAVRNTDINIFFKYLPHTRPRGIEILREAEHVILISPAYKEKLMSVLPDTMRKEIEKKIVLIPNAIDDYWHKNKNKSSEMSKDFSNEITAPDTLNPTEQNPLKLLFMGKFLKLKNIDTLIALIQKMNRKGFPVHLDMVGGNGKNLERMRKHCRPIPQISAYPNTTDKELLLKFYRNTDIFIMVSFIETFGLVYLEAMSQGKPVIYTKGEGIDGYFPQGNAGYGVNPKNLNEIETAIRNIIMNYEQMSNYCLDAVAPFNWNSVVDQYMEIYSGFRQRPPAPSQGA